VIGQLLAGVMKGGSCCTLIVQHQPWSFSISMVGARGMTLWFAWHVAVVLHRTFRVEWTAAVACCQVEAHAWDGATDLIFTQQSCCCVCDACCQHMMPCGPLQGVGGCVGDSHTIGLHALSGRVLLQTSSVMTPVPQGIRGQWFSFFVKAGQ
jgi:hypothetical protein